MGARGPVPKRSTQRRRQNKESKPEKASTATEQPEPWKAAKGWHPVAKRWFESLNASGQSQFYEESDWAVAYMLAESMSRDLKPQVVGIREDGEKAGEPVLARIPLKGASLSAYLKGMSSLLVTEGDRRRAGLELERESAKASLPPVDDVTDLDVYRDRRAS